MFQKDSDVSSNYSSVYWPETCPPCDHSHDPCQHCTHFCSGCHMTYCCKCGRTWGGWIVTCSPPYTTTNPHVDNTYTTCGHSH